MGNTPEQIPAKPVPPSHPQFWSWNIDNYLSAVFFCTANSSFWLVLFSFAYRSKKLKAWLRPRDNYWKSLKKKRKSLGMVAFTPSNLRHFLFSQFDLFSLQSVEGNRHFWHMTLFINPLWMLDTRDTIDLTEQIFPSKKNLMHKTAILFVTQIISQTYPISSGTSGEWIN